ncbi:GGDEF domain-containing protein [Clostridium aminobutyricum]|uniref:Diguanylate cyclase n=1 Tax=Clostridium aminobutyricum TaxID=33953 RepID=A0A939IHU0_CLOAM|nr:GGDEF domain-containing protein [Clostridium aminobutyricum]MBN7771809.1 diguanylate cyclase [Clostridium aminobutyricum]
MNVFLRIDINIAAMILLTVVLLIAYNHLDRTDRLNRAFLITSFVIILELFFESATCVLNGRPEPWCNPLSNLLHVCLFSAGPLLTYFLYSFICRCVVPNAYISKTEQIILLIPVVFNCIITVLSPFYALVFSIDHSNIYHRGPLFLVSAVIIYLYILIAFAFILKNRKKIVAEEFIPLLVSGILPLIGGLLQTLFYGILLMWSSSAFSLILVYIFLQQRMVHLDKLTGAWSRESFETYIAQRIKLEVDHPFGVIFADMDGLKQINDQYGHLEGDFAIRKSVELIKSVLQKKGIIARAGGDEFFILFDCNSRNQLEELIDQINTCFAQYNALSEKSYTLECSLGAELFSSSYSSIEQFINHIDHLMYANKNEKKTKKSLQD